MRPKIETYLFTQASGLKIMEYVKKIAEDRSILCFDLEDIVKDLPGDTVNAYEKELQRIAVVETLLILSQPGINIRVGVRVNIFNLLLQIRFQDPIHILRTTCHGN